MQFTLLGPLGLFLLSTHIDGNGEAVEKGDTNYARAIHHAELEEKKIFCSWEFNRKYIEHPSYRLEHTQSLFLGNTWVFEYE